MANSICNSALLLASTLVIGASSGAQAPAGLRASAPAVGEVTGKLIDSASKRPVTSGSVTIRRAGDSVFAGGALPKPDGSFRVDGLVPGSYTLRVRALGFAPLIRSGIVITAAKPSVDVGVVVLNTVATKLEGQRVVAEREEAVLAPDRNSYSTKNMTTASGGTAIDVLRNIPLVEVDGSNKVSLRGSENVVVQINGRASPLRGEQLGAFLAQLPAGTVKTVEVATNPSAKDDPEGTAGILNIVLNQEAEIGLSGGLSAGTATTGQFNTSGNIGKQQGPVTMFLSANVYRDRREPTGTISRTNLVVPVPVFVETRLDGKQRMLSGGGSLRSEYRLNKRDALTFDGYFYGGSFGGDNASYYSNLDVSRNVIGLFDQFNTSESNNSSQDYTTAFRRTGGPNLSQFTSEIQYSRNTNANDIDLLVNLIKPDPSMPVSIPAERNRNEGLYQNVNAKIDYSRPLGTTGKIDAGFKNIWRITDNDFTASYLNAGTGVYVASPGRASSFNYNENIGAAYALLSKRVQKIQTQAGIRFEQAVNHLALPLATQDRLRTRYASVYPSGIFSYNFSDLRQAKVSYSRRVSRPYPGQLSPIEYRQDTRNVFRGNPDLKPEYTDAFELGLQEARGWGSIQLNPYFRYTGNAVRNIQFVDAAGVTVSTYANVSHSKTIGSDLNVNYRHGALTMFGGASAFRYSSDASNLSGNLSARGTVWSVRANGTWKFSQLTDAQLFAYYRGPSVTEGGSQLAQVSMNAAARYKIWGDQGNISLRLSDPFGLSKFGYRLKNGTVIEYSERYFNSRAVYLTISRNFGQQLRLRPPSETESAPAAGPPSP